jgi:nucleoid-associated protein YgaU
MDATETDKKPAPGLYKHASVIRRKKRRRSFAWLFILLVLLVILGLFAGWLFYFGGMDKVKPFLDNSVQTIQQLFTKPPEPESTVVVQSKPIIEPVKVHEPAPVVQAVESPPAPTPAEQTETPPPPPPAPAPAASNNASAAIPREGVNYTIRWGDTLWSISERYYRDPKLYTRIAQHNNIRNPNQIISGRIIRIPPQN